MSSQPEDDGYAWPWYADPDRRCKGDSRYEDLHNVRGATRTGGQSRTGQIESMCTACLSCPVYYDCLKDLLVHPLWAHYGIRAGVRGKL